jgi:16S rRNA (cytosine967-C5)-methyltransferase
VLLEENEAQVQGFLEAHPDFRVVPLGEAWAGEGDVPGAGPFLSLTPRRHGTDGFFTAVLERAG